VQLLIRPDYNVKGGGDVLLAKEYATALGAAGLRATLLPATRDNLQRGQGAVHLFNVDRLVEFDVASRLLEPCEDRPLVVSPIHHPSDHVEHFEREVRSGVLKAIALAGRGAVGREQIKHVLRTRSVRGLRESLGGGDVLRSVGAALARARLVVVQAEAERRAVETTFKVALAHNTICVRNGVTFDPSIDVTGARDIDVLVVGRIEERKNQLRIANAFANRPFRVVFVGAANRLNRHYVRAFFQAVEASPNLEHVRHVPLSELYQLYARSHVCVSASYFEVVSLAELEAVAYGCQLVATTHSYVREYLDDFATYVDPSSSAPEWLAAVATSRSRGVNEMGMSHVREHYSWSSSHAHLREAYRGAGLLR
jgi:glycosyltransferase involved in cell wall biosynthesis